MTSYFTLTLDTTPPNIEIYAPSFSNKVSNNTITVVSNEPLSSYQDIYIIDSKGNRHDEIFSFDGDRTFTGNITFDNYPIGMVMIYAQLKDVVDNPSNIATANLTVITTDDSLMLDLTMSEVQRDKLLSILETDYVLTEKESVKTLSEKQASKITSMRNKITTVSDRN